MQGFQNAPVMLPQTSHSLHTIGCSPSTPAPLDSSSSSVCNMCRSALHLKLAFPKKSQTLHDSAILRGLMKWQGVQSSKVNSVAAVATCSTPSGTNLWCHACCDNIAKQALRLAAASRSNSCTMLPHSDVKRSLTFLLHSNINANPTESAVYSCRYRRN